MFTVSSSIFAMLAIRGCLEVASQRGTINSRFCPLPSYQRKFISYR